MKIKAELTTNKLDNTFEAIDDNTTKWKINSEFIFSGAMKLLAPLMKPMFAERTREDMQRFKKMVESS